MQSFNVFNNLKDCMSGMGKNWSNKKGRTMSKLRMEYFLRYYDLRNCNNEFDLLYDFTLPVIGSQAHVAQLLTNQIVMCHLVI